MLQKWLEYTDQYLSRLVDSISFPFPIVSRHTNLLQNHKTGNFVLQFQNFISKTSL